MPPLPMLDSGGNQGRLGSGCVCDSGCENCTRLAEAFVAMRDALQLMYIHFQDTDAPLGIAARTALQLAGRVRP